jgi:uncharacterized protein (TIGR02147 family)
MMKKTSIFQFIRYQDYLKEYFEARKKADPKFSHRFLSKRLGLLSPNFIMMVMQGKRKLTRSMAYKISQEFKLSKKETDYLECMVEFTRAASTKEKEGFLTRLMELRKNTNVNKLLDYQYEFYANWYHAVVRSLIDLFPRLSGDYSALAKMVYPAIRPKQAKKSVELLLRLGLLNKKKNREYGISDKRLTTGEEVQSLAVQRFHIETMKLAEQAIKRLPKDKRNMSGLTLGISQAGYDKVRELIYYCQKKIMDVADKDEKADRVYQVNFHAFPVSKVG